MSTVQPAFNLNDDILFEIFEQLDMVPYPLGILVGPTQSSTPTAPHRWA